MKKIKPFKAHSRIVILALILTGAILIAVVLVSIYGMNEHSRNLAFSYETCGADVDPYGYPYEGVLNYAWEQDTLVIEAFAKKALCGGARAAGDYQVEDDNLILLYSLNGRQTDCSCAFQLVYRISGLAQRQYSISIREMDN